MLVDATYNVNGVGMPLYCPYWLSGPLCRNNWRRHRTSLENCSNFKSFKDESSAWSDIRVIVADKNFTEWKVIKENFWDAKILIVLSMACHESNVDFDVKKCERDNVKGLLRQLIYSKALRNMKTRRRKCTVKATSSSKRNLNHNGKDVRKCGSNLNDITMHTWVRQQIIVLSLTISSSKMSRSSNLTEIFRVS